MSIIDTEDITVQCSFIKRQGGKDRGKSKLLHFGRHHLATKTTQRHITSMKPLVLNLLQNISKFLHSLSIIRFLNIIYLTKKPQRRYDKTILTLRLGTS